MEAYMPATRGYVAPKGEGHINCYIPPWGGLMLCAYQGVYTANLEKKHHFLSKQALCINCSRCAVADIYRYWEIIINSLAPQINLLQLTWLSCTRVLLHIHMYYWFTEYHPDVELEIMKIKIDESRSNQCRVQFIVSVSYFNTRSLNSHLPWYLSFESAHFFFYNHTCIFVCGI